MRKIIVISMITLDGVMQAPGGPQEDTSRGFQYGGWVAPYGDEEYGKVMEKLMKPADVLLGRKTFQIWEDYWPQNEKGWAGINDVKKYVLTTTLKNSNWENSVFIDDVSDIEKLKSESVSGTTNSDIQVWGSSEIVQLLLKNDLADELWLLIHPLLLGNGKKLFDNAAMPSAFALVESITTSTGVIIANYKRAGTVKTGTVGG